MLLKEMKMHLPLSLASRLMSNPLFQFTLAVITIGSVVWAVYTHFDNKKTRELSFDILNPRISVVSRPLSSDLTVMHKGEKIDSDISIMNLVIWNAGKQPIQLSDTLKFLVVQIEGNRQILDASISRCTRGDCKVLLNKVQLGEGKLGIAWRILEHQDGATIQITYAGPVDAGVAISGSWIEQNAPIQAPAKRLTLAPNKLITFVSWGYPAFSFASVLVIGNRLNRYPNLPAWIHNLLCIAALYVALHFFYFVSMSLLDIFFGTGGAPFELVETQTNSTPMPKPAFLF